MVKNEMSLHSQQSYNVALKIAEHEISKVNKEINKSIAKYGKLVSFKSLRQENELFNLKLAHLKENIDVLFVKNPLDAQTVYLKNEYDYIKKEASFIKVIKDDPNKHIARQEVAKVRRVITVSENNYKRNEFLAKWSNLELENEINYKLAFDAKVTSLYGDKPSLAEISYTDFYNDVVSKYNELRENALNDIKEFYPIILDVINQSYEKTFSKDVKAEILDSIKFIVESYRQIEKMLIEDINVKIDIKILNEQKKEGLDIAEELSEAEKIVATNIDAINQLKEKIAEVDATLMRSIEIDKQNKISSFDLDIKGKNDAQNAVLETIKNSFALSLKETFDIVYKTIKQYVLEKCPFFYDYLKNLEDAYNAHNVEYRKNNAHLLNKEVSNWYLNDHDKYLTYISNVSDVAEEQIIAIKKEHMDNLNKINAETKEDYKNLAIAKRKRKEAYKEQKKNYKTNVKIVDAAKAAEMREILKLYKKEIRSGEIKRYFKVFKNKRKKLALENKQYKANLYKATNSEILAFKFDYLETVKAILSKKKKEYKKLNSVLKKEYKISKFRRNFTTKSRENALGYTFLSVWAIGFIIFTFLPILYTILMLFSESTWNTHTGYSVLIDFSFTKGLTFPSWIGFKNFERLFLNEFATFILRDIPTFFRNLFFFVPLVVFIGFVLAMILNSKIKGRTLFRIIYFLPVVIVSGPVLSMLNDGNNSSSGRSNIQLTLDGSSIAKILQSMSPKVLQYANTIFSNFVMILWMTGVPIVLFISALQKINKSLYEAAEIDGANKWQMLWTITFPLIKSVMLIVCLFTIMQVTTINVYFVNPINNWVQNILRNSNPDYGLASVGAWMQTLVVLFYVLIAFLLFREKEFVSKDKNYEEIEEAKRKKQQRKAKLIEFFKINEIKNFFRKVFSPLTKWINARKAKKKRKKEMEG